ncbi:hypothetical protein H5410_010588 [Solanum commersonii]|uniref:Uncharacterized protein n=1 Tax=Solanum commersonii TaxID=4109 RepID=A0A9J6AMN2_SOLCO|nr:hypothetical protein H5410_010588 [Solanum commersonii]
MLIYQQYSSVRELLAFISTARSAGAGSIASRSMEGVLWKLIVRCIGDLGLFVKRRIVFVWIGRVWGLRYCWTKEINGDAHLNFSAKRIQREVTVGISHNSLERSQRRERF